MYCECKGVMYSEQTKLFTFSTIYSYKYNLVFDSMTKQLYLQLSSSTSSHLLQRVTASVGVVYGPKMEEIIYRRVFVICKNDYSYMRICVQF